MTILSDRDLFELAKSKNIVKIYNSDDPVILGKEVTEEQYNLVNITKDDFWLKPNESVLIQTFEFIKVPTNYSACVYERYSIKSLGTIRGRNTNATTN